MKNNKLIAQFMGIPTFKFGSTTKYNTNNKQKETKDFPENLDFLSDLKYHSSWDWLMPVVSKIYELSKINTIRTNQYRNVINLPISTPIKWVYESVILFIKWHNKNTTP